MPLSREDSIGQRPAMRPPFYSLNVAVNVSNIISHMIGATSYVREKYDEIIISFYEETSYRKPDISA